MEEKEKEGILSNEIFHFLFEQRETNFQRNKQTKSFLQFFNKVTIFGFDADVSSPPKQPSREKIKNRGCIETFQKFEFKLEIADFFSRKGELWRKSNHPSPSLLRFTGRLPLSTCGVSGTGIKMLTDHIKQILGLMTFIHSFEFNVCG